MGVFDDLNLEPDELRALADIAEVVIADPAFVDSIVEASGQRPSDDPEALALQLIQASILDPKAFDRAAEMWDKSELDFDWGKIGEGFKNAGKKVAGMFNKNKDETGKDGGGKVKEFFGKIFGGAKGNAEGVKGKLAQWKENRALKKQLKADGTFDKSKWKDYKRLQKGKEPKGDSFLTPSTDEYMLDPTTKDGIVDAISQLPPEFQQQALQLVEAYETKILALNKTKKIWMYATIGLGVALVGVIAFMAMKAE